MGVLKYLQNLFSAVQQHVNVNHCKMVIVVRKDISMTTGKVAAQCAHAAVECYRQSSHKTGSNFVCKKWILTGQPKIVLQARNKEELLDLYNKAKATGLVVSKIADAGATELIPGTITAIGIGPGDKDEINKITSKLKLL